MFNIADTTKGAGRKRPEKVIYENKVYGPPLRLIKPAYFRILLAGCRSVWPTLPAAQNQVTGGSFMGIKLVSSTSCHGSEIPPPPKFFF